MWKLKLLEENIESTKHDLRMGQDFLNGTLFTPELRPTIYQGTSLNSKASAEQK